MEPERPQQKAKNMQLVLRLLMLLGEVEEQSNKRSGFALTQKSPLPRCLCKSRRTFGWGGRLSNSNRNWGTQKGPSEFLSSSLFHDSKVAAEAAKRVSDFNLPPWHDLSFG